MSMGGGNPAIEISVTARIDQLEAGLNAAQAKVEQAVAPIGQAGERAGDAFAKKFGAVMKAAGVFAMIRAFTKAGEAASEAFAQGASAPDVARAFVEDLQQTLFNIPIAGDVAKIFDNLLNGAEKAGKAAAEKYAAEFQDMTARMLSTRDVNIKTEQALQRAVTRGAEELTLGTTDEGKIEIARREKIRDLDEQIADTRRKQQLEVAGFMKPGQTKGEELARQAAVTRINEQFDGQVRLLEVQKRQAEAKASQDAKALADGKALEAQTKAQAEAIKAQEEATKAAEAAAKAKRESDIKALEQSGKAREDAIAAQIAALQGQSPAARAASIGALTQQFAGNMGGSIQTALGTFRSGGAAVAERAYQEAKAQTEKQERIVRLQEEMKRLHEETNRKIDAMKGAA